MPLPTPFRIHVPDSLLTWIQQRVSTARIPEGESFPPGKEWDHGVPPSVMQHLKEYWTSKYDWRSVEARINGQLKQFTLPIEHEEETITMHFVHHRSEKEGAIPLLFQHGWPGSILEVKDIIDLLTNPSDPTQQPYHVVAPSLPGFGYSSPSKNPDFRLVDIATINNKLMVALGYPKYIAQGGDWGSMISRFAAITHPENVLGCHVNMIVATPPSWWRKPFSFLRFIIWAVWTGGNKSGFLGRMMYWMKEESGYMEIQSTKPQTITYSLSDSPLGQLAWILDKTHALTDTYTFTSEDIITWAMMYIIPGTTAQASIYTNSKGPKAEFLASYLLGNRISGKQDFGASLFPKEVFNVPRFWAEASVAKNIVFWREHGEGGHFAATERPEALVGDIREFTGAMEGGRLAALRVSGKLKV